VAIDHGGGAAGDTEALIGAVVASRVGDGSRRQPSNLRGTIVPKGIFPCALQSVRCDPAKPRKTRTARLRRTTSASSSLPTRLPTLLLGTVVIMSTISRDCCSSPLLSLGSTDNRIGHQCLLAACFSAAAGENFGNAITSAAYGGTRDVPGASKSCLHMTQSGPRLDGPAALQQTVQHWSDL
jgi:hypothetical protein